LKLQGSIGSSNVSIAMKLTDQLKQACNRYFVAQTFMTRLPSPVKLHWSDSELAQSTPWFAPVGIVVGLIAALAWWIGYTSWSPTLAAVFAVTASVLATGAFHEDGLADSADGIGGAFELEKKLTIMRDSRIGTYGSVALILVIIAKVSAISLLDPATATGTIVGAHMLGRWTSVPLIKNNRYVREQGTGKPFASAVTLQHVFISSVFVLLCCTVCFAAKALLVIPLVMVGLWCAQWYVRRKLGGITGDVLGAINSLTELLVYLIMSSSFVAIL